MNEIRLFSLRNEEALQKKQKHLYNSAKNLQCKIFSITTSSITESSEHIVNIYFHDLTRV